MGTPVSAASFFGPGCVRHRRLIRRYCDYCTSAGISTGPTLYRLCLGLQRIPASAWLVCYAHRPMQPDSHCSPRTGAITNMCAARCSAWRWCPGMGISTGRGGCCCSSKELRRSHAVLRFVARSVNHGASMTPALSSKVSSAHRNMYIQLDLHWTLGSYSMVCTGHCHCGLNAGLQRTPALYT